MGEVHEEIQQFNGRNGCQKGKPKTCIATTLFWRVINDLFDTLPDTGEDNDYKEACEALTRYFTPKKNLSFEIFKFRNLKQESHETVDEFHTHLQIASKYCETRKKKLKHKLNWGHRIKSYDDTHSIRLVSH